MKTKIIDGETYCADTNLRVVNFDVVEEWWMKCPNCYYDHKAPFNVANPMEPMPVECKECGEKFILTYERE